MKKQNIKKLQKECDDFNSKYPVGTQVFLKKDFVDEPVKTVVRHAAYVLSGHSAVAFFEGISGCYLISCVKGPCAHADDDDNPQATGIVIGGKIFQQTVPVDLSDLKGQSVDALIANMHSTCKLALCY